MLETSRKQTRPSSGCICGPLSDEDTMHCQPRSPQGTHQLIEQITRDALRNAATAPTYMQALDITGAALVAVAMLVRMEARHA